MAITNATLAQKINDLIVQWETFQAEQQAWMNGVVGGGAGADGKYPLTDYQANIVLATCPAQLEDDVSNLVTGALGHKNAAETAQTAAELAETNAETAETNAETAETGSVTAKVASEAAQSAAESARTTAIAQAAVATAKAVLTAADAVATALDADTAEQWANRAEDSLIPAANGGDEVDDYSSFHWAQKSEDFSINEALYAALADAEVITGKYSFTGLAAAANVGGSITLKSANPGMNIQETDAAVDEKNWIHFYTGGNYQMRLYNDAWSSHVKVINVNRAGTTGSVDIIGALTATSFGGITSADLVDLSDAETISGIWRHDAQLRLANSVLLAGLNNAGSSWKDLLHINTSDKVVLGGTTTATQIRSTVAPVWYDGSSSRSMLADDVAEIISGQWSFTSRIDIDDAVLRLDSRGSGTSYPIEQRIDNSSASRPYWYLYDDANVKQWDCLMTTGGSIQWRNVGVGNEMFLSFVPSEGVRIRDGLEFRIYDSTDVDYKSQKHDGTGFVNTYSGTTYVTYTGHDSEYHYAHMYVSSGHILRVYDSGNTDFLSMSHNSTDFNFAFTNTDEANWTGAHLQMTDNGLYRPVIKDYSLTKHVETSSSNVLTIDMELGNVVDHTFTEDVTTVTISNPPASGTFGEVWLRLIQHASAAKTITWASAYHFPGGTDHVMSTGVNDVDVVHLTTIDGGTTWLCTFVQDMG